MTRDRFLQARVGIFGAVLVLLAGCAGTDADTATPAAPTPSVPASSQPPASSQSPTDEPVDSSPWDTSGPSFGVDRVSWPPTAEGAHKLLESLPPTLGGETLRVDYQPVDKREGYGATATADYGRDLGISVTDEYVTSDTASGKPELFTASQLLASQFGLVFGCEEKSYRGTIKPLEGGGGPGLDPPKGKSASKPAWFSCTIVGAEGDDNFKGYAVGWTSKKAAWLLIAEDEKSARSLIAGLEPPTR